MERSDSTVGPCPFTGLLAPSGEWYKRLRLVSDAVGLCCVSSEGAVVEGPEASVV